MEPTKLQELKKKEMRTNRECILWFRERLSDDSDDKTLEIVIYRPKLRVADKRNRAAPRKGVNGTTRHSSREVCAVP